MANSRRLTDRQKDILSTALEIVANEGTRSLTMKRVAQALNVTEPAIYRHFESKRHLLLSLYSYVELLFLTGLRPIVSMDLPVKRRLYLFVENILNYLSEHKGVNLILLAETIYHKDEQLRKAMLSIFLGVKGLAAELLKEGIKTGDLRADILPDEYATCLVGMIQGVLTQHILEQDGKLKVKKETETILDCFLQSLEKSEITS